MIFKKFRNNRIFFNGKWYFSQDWNLIHNSNQNTPQKQKPATKWISKRAVWIQYTEALNPLRSWIQSFPNFKFLAKKLWWVSRHVSSAWTEHIHVNHVKLHQVGDCTKNGQIARASVTFKMPFYSSKIEAFTVYLFKFTVLFTFYFIFGKNKQDILQESFNF